MNQKIKYIGEGIVDCHTHSGAMDINNFYNKKYPAMYDVRQLESVMKEKKIDYTITFPMPSTLYYNVNSYWRCGTYSPTGICDFPFAIENEYMLSEIQYFEMKNILPFLSFSLNEKISNQCRYIRKCYCEFKYGIYGLKYHSKADQNSLIDLMDKGKEILELLIDLNIPLLFHCETNGISSPVRVFDLVEKYPKLRISLAHYAGMNADFFREYDEYIKTERNIFFDTAPSLCMCKRYSKSNNCKGLLPLNFEDAKMVNRYFLDKYPNYVLWGSDSPWLFSDNLLSKSEDIVEYDDELMLRKQLEEDGYNYKIEAVNGFLFGI